MMRYVNSRVFWVFEYFCKDLCLIVSFWKLKQCIDDIILWRDDFNCRGFKSQSGEDMSVYECYVYVGATFVRTNSEIDGGDNTLIDDYSCSCNLNCPLYFSFIINCIIVFGFFAIFFLFPAEFTFAVELVFL